MRIYVRFRVFVSLHKLDPFFHQNGEVISINERGLFAFGDDHPIYGGFFPDFYQVTAVLDFSFDHIYKPLF
jgi:hypothetical protein